MSSIILPVAHRRQDDTGECLAACAAMALAYLGVAATYDQLLKLLRVEWYGAPSSNIRRLEQLGIVIIYKAGNLEELHAYLLQDYPCIAFIKTGELPYWNQDLAHAVVIVGLDDDYVYLNDPEFANAPMQVSRGDFSLAWLEQGEMYAALIRRD